MEKSHIKIKKAGVVIRTCSTDITKTYKKDNLVYDDNNGISYINLYHNPIEIVLKKGYKAIIPKGASFIDIIKVG